MALSEHKPYSPLKPDGTQVFHSPVITIVKNMRKRMLIQDTDIGKELVLSKLKEIGREPWDRKEPTVDPKPWL